MCCFTRQGERRDQGNWHLKLFASCSFHHLLGVGSPGHIVSSIEHRDAANLTMACDWGVTCFSLRKVPPRQ